MEEIKVGEYVRTKKGEICKVLGIRPEFKTGKRIYGHKAYYLDRRKGSLTPAFIAKHSFNIIDLIEVGDIIKTKHPAFEKIYYEHIWNKEYLEHIVAFLKEKSLIIKSIVTHEQFAQIEYKVEE